MSIYWTADVPTSRASTPESRASTAEATARRYPTAFTTAPFATGPAGSSSVARIFVLFGKEATMSAHEHVWRPTGYGGGSACSGKPATTFHHERCEKCGASRRVDHPSRAVRDHQEER